MFLKNNRLFAVFLIVGAMEEKLNTCFISD